MLDLARDIGRTSEFITAQTAFLAVADSNTWLNEFKAYAPITPSRKSSELFAHDDDPRTTYSSLESTLKMLEEAERRLAKFPDSVSARCAYGITLFHAGNIESARYELTSVLRTDPDNRLALRYLAQIYLQTHDSDEASHIGSRLLEGEPESPDNYALMARILDQLGHSCQSLQMWTNAVHAAPSNPYFQYNFGLASLKANHLRAAAGSLREAVHLDPHFLSAYQALALAYTEMEQIEKAIEVLSVAHQLLPGDPNMQAQLARLLIGIGKHSEALKLLDTPRNVLDVYRMELLAWAYYGLGKYTECRRELIALLESPKWRASLTIDQRARTLNNLGVCYIALDNLPKAQASFEHALRISDQDDSVLYLNFASLLLETGEFGRALSLLESIPVTSRDERVELLTVHALRGLGKQWDALQAIKSLVSSSGSESSLVLLSALLAETRLIDTEPTIAISSLRSAFDSLPTHPVIGNNYAYALLVNDDLLTARSVLRQLQHFVGTNAAITATAGLLRIKEGSLESGYALYERAEQIAYRQRNPELASSARQKKHLEMARALYRRGELTDANDHVRRGLPISTTSNYYQDLLELQKVINASLKESVSSSNR